MRAAFCVVLGALVASCGGGPSEPAVAAVTGAYALERVDGAALPAPLVPATGECPIAVVAGDFSLSPRVSGRRPLYAIQIFVRPSCEPPSPPVRGTELLRDFGPWSLRGSRVELRSENGFGTYAGVLDAAAAGGGPDPVVTVRVGGRTYTFRRLRPFG